MVRKAVFWLVVGFAAFYLWSEPTEAAGAVRDVIDLVIEVFESIVVFFTTLAG